MRQTKVLLAGQETGHSLTGLIGSGFIGDLVDQALDALEKGARLLKSDTLLLQRLESQAPRDVVHDCIERGLNLRQRLLLSR